MTLARDRLSWTLSCLLQLLRSGRFDSLHHLQSNTLLAMPRPSSRYHCDPTRAPPLISPVRISRPKTLVDRIRGEDMGIKDESDVVHRFLVTLERQFEWWWPPFNLVRYLSQQERWAGEQTLTCAMVSGGQVNILLAYIYIALSL